MTDCKIDSAVRRRVMQDLLNPQRVRESVTRPQSIAKARYCSGCGQQLNPDFNYCPMCGEELGTGQITNKEDMPINMEKGTQSSQVSMLEEVMRNKEQSDEEVVIDEKVRKAILDKGVNMNIISGLLG